VDIHETIAEVKQLLERIPGVEVVWVEMTSPNIRFGLRLRSLHSLVPLVQIASTYLVMMIDPGWKGAAGDPDCLIYDLRVPLAHDVPEGERGFYLLQLGVVLAHHLKESERLEPAEADRLLNAWTVVREGMD
jgi:hypothetical protein